MGNPDLGKDRGLHNGHQLQSANQASYFDSDELHSLTDYPETWLVKSARFSTTLLQSPRCRQSRMGREPSPMMFFLHEIFLPLEQSIIGDRRRIGQSPGASLSLSRTVSPARYRLKKQLAAAPFRDRGSTGELVH